MDDRSGERFGDWIVVGPARLVTSGVRLRRYWPCLCLRCKKTRRHVQEASLVSGASTGCGCRKRETWKNRQHPALRHGMARLGQISPEYQAWSAMLTRCRNPNDRRYADYGARGITVCKRWHVFDNFFADLGLRPKGMRLGRLDTNKGFTKRNARWMTLLESMNSQRKCRILTYRGKRKTVAEWARTLGLDPHRVYERLHRGASTKEALAPVVQRQQR
jgi:hypothetical protein